jgi:CubicO group peptidase (beta-lactamase class C family)
MNTATLRIHKKSILGLLLVTLFIAGCSGGPVEYVYQAPTQLEDGLIVGTIDEVGMDANTLGKAVDRIRDGKWGAVHSLLIYKDGKLVLEEYFPGHEYQFDRPNYQGAYVNWDQGRRHKVFSAGKSITSACIGIAIDEGFIESVDQSIFEYLPEYQHYATDGKDRITIEHLLTMTSGLKWKEWGASYSDPQNDVFRLWEYCEDPVECILEKPLATQPGTDYNYSGGDMTVLGKIIQNATGLDIEAFSWQYLFEPMGVESPPWLWIDDSGVIYAAGEQELTPREMLKFGATYLNNGTWDGQQLISEEWVYLSSVPYGNNSGIKVPGSDGGRKGYSYTWWLWDVKHNGETLNTFSASGWGGQKIMVIPDLDTVVVFTGGNFTSKTYTHTIVEDYILAAIQN